MRQSRFSNEKNYISNNKMTNHAQIIFTGDLLCEAGMYKAGNYDGYYSFYSCFRYVKNIFSKADWVIGNLETMICQDAPYTGEIHKIEGKYHNNAPLEFLRALKYAGYDTFVCSNNHNCDCGVKGIEETLYYLEQEGFSHTGLYAPAESKAVKQNDRLLIACVNGIKIGLLSYSTWFNRNEDRFTSRGKDELLNIYTKERVQKDINTIKKSGAEFIIIYMHWGIDAEYSYRESLKQRMLAAEVAEAGADYIIGSHTHSVQKYEILTTSAGKKVPVAFSMGNFATSERASISRDTIILSLTLKKCGTSICIDDEYYIPCHIFDYYKGDFFPIIPAISELNGGENHLLLTKAYTSLLRATGSCLRCFGHKGNHDLSLHFVCRCLGMNIPLEKDIHYTTINFAEDARKNGIAVICPITSDPGSSKRSYNNEYLADLAISKGAALLLSHQQIKDYPCLIVPDVFEAYTSICANIRKIYSPRTVGITGSIGKTTTTEMIFAVINSKWNTLRSTGSANSVRYASYVVQQLNNKYEAYVQEIMEGPPAGAAATISKIVQPELTVVTVVGTSHLECFGTQEKIAESCLGIQEGMPENGTIFLNADDPQQQVMSSNINIKTYGIENITADFLAKDIKTTENGMSFTACYGGKNINLEIHCFGKHNIMNALAAFAVGHSMGMSDEEIRQGLLGYRTSGIRQNLITVGKYHLFLDCYNAAPESIKTAFETFV